METKNIVQHSLGGLIVIGFFTLLITLAIVEVPALNKDLLNLAVGALIGSFATVVQYFYGSSLGSADKNALLTKQNGTTTEVSKVK